MKKRLIGLLLVLTMVVTMFSGCLGGGKENDPDKTSDGTGNQTSSDAGTDKGLPPMTTENITLTYACWGLAEKGETEVRDKQLAGFMAKYPNIKVEFVNIDQGTWNEGLYNMAAAGTLPDVFWVFSVTEAVKNEWALDVTDMFNADPDTKEIYPSVREMAQINGRRYSVPTVMFPHVMFMNKTLFKKYNIPMPSYDWKVDEFIDLAKKLSHPEDYYFGTSNPLYYDLFDAWYNGNTRYGWDGKNYNLGEDWVKAMNLRYEFIDNKVCEWMTAEEKEKILGKPDAWPPGLGRTAMHIDWPWTIAMFQDVVPQQSGCEFTFYPLPKGPTGKQMAIIDNGVISATTQHPREAWELQKWTSWGADACNLRLEGYKEAGAPMSRLPVTTNKEVWNKIIANAPNDDFKALYERLTDVVPSPWPIAPGWGEFEAWMNEQDMWGKLDRREVAPADVAPELNKKLNEFKQQYIDSLQ